MPETPTDDWLRATEDTYITALQALTAAANLILQTTDHCDITAMRALINRYETIGPILEPTAYQRGGGTSLREQATFLEAVDEFVTKLRRLEAVPRGRDANRDVK